MPPDPRGRPARRSSGGDRDGAEAPASPASRAPIADADRDGAEAPASPASRAAIADADRDGAGAPADAPLLSNGELARIFSEIGDLVELKGELVYKAVAYRRAADAIAHSPVEVARAYREGHPPRLAGVGEAIAGKIAELAETGRLGYHERLLREVPRTLLEILAIPGLGPRSVRELHDALGVLTLADVEAAARAGRVRGLRGMTERTEERILEGIEALGRQSRRLLQGEAETIVERLVAGLQGTEGLVSLTPAGSFRRRRETIGDLDLLAATTDPGALVERLGSLPDVERVIAAGPARSSIQLRAGPSASSRPGRHGARSSSGPARRSTS